MADNSVFITGAANGAFTDALSDLPAWATEKTLVEIKKLLGGKGAGGSRSVGLSDLDKLIERLKRRDKDEEAAAKKRKKEAEEKRKDELLYGKRLESASDKLAWASQKFEKFTSSVLDSQKTTFDVFASLQDSGISVITGFDNATTGFEALTQMTNLTGIKMKDLAVTLQKYDTAVNTYSLGKFSKTLGMARKGLEEFGFNSKESAELLGSYLESQMNFTNIRNKSDKQTAAEVTDFGAKIRSLSLATGQSKNAILANIEAISKSTQAMILTRQVGEKGALATNAFLSSIKDENLKTIMSKMMTDAIGPLNQTFQNFAKMGQGAFGQELAAFTQSLKGMDPELARKAQQAWVESHKAEMDRMTDLANMYSQVPGLASEANSVLEAIRGMQQTANQFNEDAAKANDPAVKARARFSSAMNELSSKFEVFFGKVLTPIIDIAASGIEVINSFFTFLGNIPGVTTVTSLLGSLAVGLGGLWSAVKALRPLLSIIEVPLSALARGLMALVNPVTKVIGVFVAAYGVGTMLYKTISSFEWFNSMMDTIFAGLDRVLQFIPGLSSDAKERIATREKIAALSVPATPKQTPINSPSADNTAKSSSEPAQAVTPSGAMVPGLDKKNASGDINSSLAYQGSLTEQMLLALNRLVSVNGDILKYAKLQA